jgi:tRNA-specific 2-thiouridylase
MPERVLVAMSGGVDSAVAAALLHQQGYEVIGVTLRLYTEPDDTALRSNRTCCGIEDIGDARAAAQQIGIPHYTLNMEREFEEAVLDPFVQAYAAGRTPNPCLNCNQYLKFSTLLDRALAMGVDRLATGHYARVEAADGGYRLYRAADPAKDQSYVLYTLDQIALARTLFPLADLEKSDTRAVAREFGLPLAEKPDSVDICFVPGGDYRAVLRERGISSPAGDIQTVEGVTIGQHDGIANYTVGQRRGLGITAEAPRYVTNIDAQRNIVVMGSDCDLAARSLVAREPHWVLQPPTFDEPLTARVRYHADEVPCHVTALSADGFELGFETPVRAVAPGQAVVLYRGTEVVGGGTIERGHA